MTEAADYERTDLSDLIRDRRDYLGLTYDDLAALCIDPETADRDPDAEALWSRSTLHTLAQGRRVKAPNFAMIRALAAGLQVNLRAVQEAAGAQFLGIVTAWSPDGRTRTFLEGFEEMEVEDQEKVLALMRAWKSLKQP